MYVTLTFLILFAIINAICAQITKPIGWQGANNTRKPELGKWLILGDATGNLNYSSRTTEYEGYDGWYNNIARPDLGAIDRPLLRRWPAAYADGSYLPSGEDRPNPLELSEKLLSGEIGRTSFQAKSALLVFFGQQVVEEILDAQRAACPPEYFNIKIPDGHAYRKNVPFHTEMPFLRTRYDQRTGYSPNNPRQQLNEITPYIDGGLFYGITKQWSDQLRTYKNGTVDPDGRLAFSHEGLFPEENSHRLPMANPPPPFNHSEFIQRHELAKVSRFFKLGNPRGNENAFLLTFGIMWFRWHNYLAETIRQANHDWSSEKVFNEARKWVIATQQNIYMYEWLPTWLNSINPEVNRIENYLANFFTYQGYDPSVDPQIDQFFQAAAFRFGHTLVVPGVYLRNYKRKGCQRKFSSWNKESFVRTCNIFWRPQEPLTRKDDENGFIDIDRVLMGMSVQMSEAEDNIIVEDLRGNVFGPLEFPRRDLMAVNVQRGRDHGLPDYNTARRAYNLPMRDFSYFDGRYPNSSVSKDLRELYRNDSMSIDPWIGGILETEPTGPGELFSKVILDQFNRIRNGDRFWFENEENNLFTKTEIARIKMISVYDIIMAVTKMDADDIPLAPFRVAKKGADDALISSCNLTKHDSLEYYAIKSSFQDIEQCKQPTAHYDYFSNSEFSFIFTFIAIGTFIIGIFGVIYFLIKNKEQQFLKIQNTKTSEKRDTIKTRAYNDGTVYVAEEIVSKSLSRNVLVCLCVRSKQILVQDYDGVLLRAIDLKSSSTNDVQVCLVSDKPIIVINSKNNYDLVIDFKSNYVLNTFKIGLDGFASKCNLTFNFIKTLNWSSAQKVIVTKDDRQKKLEMFFRVVFAQAFDIKHKGVDEVLKVGDYFARQVFNTELTIEEFAEALSMKASNEFVKRMFTLVDKDGNGFISFREFIDLLILFANGTDEEKAKLLFNMYNINGTGLITAEDFIQMIKSFLETVDGTVSDQDIEQTVMSMMRVAGVERKKQLDFNDFKKMIGKDISKLNEAKLGFSGVKKEHRKSYLHKARETLENIYDTRDLKTRIQGGAEASTSFSTKSLEISKAIDDAQTRVIEEHKKSPVKSNKFVTFLKYVELKKLDIFWMSLYTLILLAIFAEHYSVEREHSGLRRIAGYGVTVTRGAASAMMFTYSSLLVTMCRNTITYLRDTVVNRYFSFDSMVDIHKYIAFWALVFTIIHIVGHAFNFYHISTQTADDLTCLFRNYFHATHELPKFHYWCWQTMTGFTGVVLTLLGAIMYIFALKVFRAKIYNWFWYTHSMYPLFFIFMVLHGTGRLIQPPFTYYFLLGPVILFTIDKLISLSRKRIEIPVIRTEILPSNVTMLEFRKPDNFQFRAGQWVRIACLGLNSNEFHPFTLSSAPNEDNLTVHIRSVGPWTTLMRQVYDKSIQASSKLPNIYLDGPYGEGHQDWNLYDVSILIGGGIGVTPFASILKDIAYQSKSARTKCKQVYFIWVSRTQKQFEWFVDIIRAVEQKDTTNFVSSHIFITQFYEKFDLRTTLLYICELHYQRISNKSLFTNLKTVTHFGRPSFKNFFRTVESLHTSANRIGIFSCGPPSMTTSVEKACSILSQESNKRFEHHFKNF